MSPHAGEHTTEPDHHGGGLEFVTPIFGHEGKTGIVWLFVNFAVLLWILDRLMFRPLRARQAERHDALKAELAHATATRKDAERLIEDFRERTARLDAEVQEILVDAKHRGDLERQAIVAEAEREAERIREAAQAAATREADLRRRAIEAEVLDRAVTRAESILREHFTPADQQRLFDTYASRLETLDLREGGRSASAGQGGTPS